MLKDCPENTVRACPLAYVLSLNCFKSGYVCLPMQCFHSDEEKISEFSRAHDVEWERLKECRLRWLAGDIRLPDAASAADWICRKATLTSPDDEHLRSEIISARQRSLSNTVKLRQQGHVARGCMLHKQFPALPAAGVDLHAPMQGSVPLVRLSER